MSENIELSVVILCYRSGESIIPFANEVKALAQKLTPSFEIVLVGNYVDGSDDNTKEIVQQLAKEDSCFVAIAKEKKGMMGWDMKEGLMAAIGEYICVIDGDGQFPIDSIEKCFNDIKNNNLDLVKTYRSSRGDGFYRKTTSFVYNMMFRVLFPGLGSRDINSKPKIIKKTALDQMNLQSTDWFIDAELMIHVRRFKMKFSEFPVIFSDHTERQSFVKFGAIVEFIRNLIIYRFNEFFIKK